MDAVFKIATVVCMLVLGLPFCIHASPANLDAPTVRQVLALPDDSLSSLWNIQDELIRMDAAAGASLLSSLENKVSGQNEIFSIKLDWLKARWLVSQSIDQHFIQIDSLARQGWQKAKKMEALHMLAELSELIGSVLNTRRKPEEAVSYLVEAIIIQEKLGAHSFPYPERCNGALALVLFDLGEYASCAYYYSRGLALGDSRLADHVKMNGSNTIGVCYRRIGMFDSARAAFKRAQHYANRENNSLWKGIIAGNYGQLHFLEGNLDSARILLTQDYEANLEWKEWPNVANALQWLARIDLAQHQPAAALAKSREALQLLQAYPRSDYLEYTLFTAADAHRALGKTDSFYFYLSRYQHLHDSLALSSRPDIVAITRLQLSKDNAIMRNNQLEAKRKEERLWRNGLIALVFVLGAAAIWIQIVTRRKMEAERQLALSKQAAAAADMEAARQKLSLFTQTVLEKNAAIAQMEEQLAKVQGQPNEATVKQLSEGSLLTDDDWKKFRELFEVPYPGFLHRLRHQYPSITPSEIRMAALIRLQLSAKEMASILGISTISIYKSRQRLRQRIGAESDEQLETLLGSL
jgi:DNA-binding CsgD family transcriptional regulator/tetratricopeptide (TPR) repeat protein